MQAPYFTDLNEALAYVAQQNPTWDQPWTVMIFPGFYQGDADGIKRDGDDDDDDPTSKTTHRDLPFKLPKTTPQPQCPSWMLKHIRSLHHQSFARQHDGQKHQLDAMRSKIRAQLDPSLMMNNQRLDPTLSCKSKSPRGSKMTQDPTLNAMRPLAATQVPANVTLHALAKYTVVIDHALRFNNDNNQISLGVAFENLVLTREIQYERTSVDANYVIYVDNCDFIEASVGNTVGLSLLDATGASVQERLSIKNCWFGHNSHLLLFNAGLTANIESSTLTDAFIEIGQPVSGRQQVNVLMNMVNSKGCTLDISSDSIIQMSGSFAETDMNMFDASAAMMHQVNLRTLTMNKSSTLTGQLDLESIIMSETSAAIIRGSINTIQLTRDTRLDLTGPFTAVNNDGIFNPWIRTFSAIVPPNTLTPTTINFGSRYTSSDYNVTCSVGNRFNPAETVVFQVVSKDVDRLVFQVSPARGYEISVDVMICIRAPNLP